MSVRIPLGKSGLFTTIDDIDYENVSRFKWVPINTNGEHPYAYCSIHMGFISGKRQYAKMLLHRYLIRPPKGMVTDHLNHDTLDNRRCNLRICTLTQNKQNSKPYRNTTSNYKGVCFVRTYNSYKKWLSQLRVNRKLKYLGYFNSEIEAARAYDRAAINYFGEFAHLNFPRSNYGNQ